MTRIIRSMSMTFDKLSGIQAMILIMLVIIMMVGAAFLLINQLVEDHYIVTSIVIILGIMCIICIPAILIAWLTIRWMRRSPRIRIDL